MTAVTNPRGYTTTMAYDGLDRATKITDALSNVTTAVYDAASNLTALVDARGNRTTFAYDVLNQPTAVTDPLSHTTTTVYDSVGNVTTLIDALNFRTTVGYDALNRQTSIQDPGGGIATTVYDLASNVTNSIDRLGNKTTYAYDLVNRLTTTTDPRAGVTTTVYDAVSNVTNIIDSVGNKTTYVYDSLDRVTQITDPLGKSATIAYDKASRMTSTTDRLGRRRDLSYDNASRLTGETWVTSGSTINTLTYTYDANDNLLTSANNNGTVTMTYDAVDRVSTQKDMWGLALTYSYDAVSNPTQVQDSLGGLTTSTYDNANRLTTREFSNGGSNPLREDLTYTDRNQISTETRYSDLSATTKVGSTTYTYDGVGRVTNLQHRNSGGSLLANYTYTYDLASRVSTETANGSTTTYSYDSTNQVTNDSATTYTYDLNGNRTMTGYSTGTGNRVSNDGTWTYTYDDSGNLTKKSKGANAETWTYGYDHDNHLLWVEQRSTDGGTLLQRLDFKYDAFGDRVEKDVTINSTTTATHFGYDNNPLAPGGGEGQGEGVIWADLNGSNSLQTRRFYLDAIDSVFARQSSSGTTAWYLPDRLGSIRNIVDSGGALIDTMAYDGFGVVTSESNTANGDRYKFAGYQQDSETGLYHLPGRDEDPKTARWLQEDPLGLGPDSNPYRYVGNNSQNLTDPSGLAPNEGASASGPLGSFSAPIDGGQNPMFARTVPAPPMSTMEYVPGRDDAPMWAGPYDPATNGDGGLVPFSYESARPPAPPMSTMEYVPGRDDAPMWAGPHDPLRDATHLERYEFRPGRDSAPPASTMEYVPGRDDAPMWSGPHDPVRDYAGPVTLAESSKGVPKGMNVDPRALEGLQPHEEQGIQDWWSKLSPAERARINERLKKEGEPVRTNPNSGNHAFYDAPRHVKEQRILKEEAKKEIDAAWEKQRKQPPPQRFKPPEPKPEPPEPQPERETWRDALEFIRKEYIFGSKMLWNALPAALLNIVTLGFYDAPDDLLITVTDEDRERGYDIGPSKFYWTFALSFGAGKLMTVPGWIGKGRAAAAPAGNLQWHHIWPRRFGYPPEWFWRLFPGRGQVQLPTGRGTIHTSITNAWEALLPWRGAPYTEAQIRAALVEILERFPLKGFPYR